MPEKHLQRRIVYHQDGMLGWAVWLLEASDSRQLLSVSRTILEEMLF